MVDDVRRVVGLEVAALEGLAPRRNRRVGALQGVALKCLSMHSTCRWELTLPHNSLEIDTQDINNSNLEHWDLGNQDIGEL